MQKENKNFYFGKIKTKGYPKKNVFILPGRNKKKNIIICQKQNV